MDEVFRAITAREIISGNMSIKNDNVVGLTIDSDGADYALEIVSANGPVEDAMWIHNDSNTEQVRLLRDRTATSGTNYFFRNLASADTAGPIIGIGNTNSGDDQALIAFTQTADVKVLDFDGCSDGGTSQTTVAGSIKVEMPNGSTGYINLYT